MKDSYILILILFCWIGQHKLKARDIYFHKVTTSQGLSHNTVYSIVQDYKGFMWFGTREGLNRFDSDEIITYYANHNDSLSLGSNHITALQLGSDSLLYIGTANGLHIFDDKKGVFRRIEHEGKSLGLVNQIFIAKDKSVFICTNRGLFVRKTGEAFVRCLISDINILDLIEFKQDVYWASSLQQILMINSYGETIKKYTSIPVSSDEQVNLRQNISCLYKDSFGQIWIGTKKNGLFRYDEQQDFFKAMFTDHKYNPLEVNIVRAISEDMDHNLWIGTESGLFIYDRTRNSFQRYSQSFDKSSETLNDKAIYSIYRSKEGIMWLGTYFGGVNMVRPKEKGFYRLKADGGVKALSGKAISQIIEDRKGRIWIASEDGGINIWDREKNTFKYLRNIPGKNSLSVDNVHALHEDPDGTVWIGTFLGGLNKYEPSIGKITVFENRSNEIGSFTNNMVYAIHRDRNNTLWIGTQAGLSYFDNKLKAYVPFMPEVFSGKFVYEIYEESSGGLWICIMNSDTLYYYHPETSELKTFHYGQSDLPAISYGIISALEDSKGRIWFGTVNQGLILLDSSNRSFKYYTVQEGLPNNYVYGILEDNKHNLWLSTNKGLTRFNVEDGEISKFDISHGLSNNQSNFKSAFKSEDGWMFFGTINGLTYFHPDSLILNDIPPKVYFSDFKLFNTSVPISEKSLLSSNIDAKESITLEYKENVITFEYSAINYFSLGNNQYAYYLEGFENGWNYVGDKKSATYTNLSPGNYIFKVKAANNDGLWSEDIKEIEVIILPPFWLTKWAMAVYGCLLICLILLYRAFLNYRHKEKMAMQVERLEREKITEVNQHKINFFTYISHEFKTPLTLIIASIDKFLLDTSGNPEFNPVYKTIKRNAKRLHFLIDQLMEFRRVESDHAKINYSKGDIILFLKDTFNAFIPLFTKKKIDFHFFTTTDSYVTYFDSDKIEKIVTNLLSNAAKYTPDGGLVEMEVKVVTDKPGEGDLIRISISDSGHGIDQKELERVFTTFYQTSHGKTIPDGTGIGLALVKSLVEFLRGKIEAESSLYSGTFITVSLPLTNELNNQEVTLIDGNKTIDIEHELVMHSNDRGHSSGNPGMADHEYRLMIVEDNEEIMDFLIDHFSGSYDVIKACNGKKALEKIEKAIPDIIISDVMMPEMNGIDLCQEIKSNIKTSHIPVILLTAKTTMENRLEGLDVGADAYISKPFNQRELELHIKNLLESRHNLKKHFLKFGNIKDVEISINNRDEDFLIKLSGIVEEHLEDPDFNITAFTREAGVSRTLLHLKLKKLANLSALEFIKTIRMNHAAELLKKTDLPVSEVGYKVGFSDPNYFSRSFKDRYDITPSSFRESCSEGPPSVMTN